MAEQRMPTLFVPHGGGPWPWMKPMAPGMMDPLRTYFEGLPASLPAKPKAILLVSAHWEEAVPTVMTAKEPPMLYDYYGFPEDTYTIKWPAPGAPEVAARTRELLEAAKIRTGANAERGFDHGTFVVTKLTHPQADIPTFQLSLVRGLDPAAHLAMGRALAPLRDEGVLILGSGMSYHNMRGFRTAMGRRFQNLGSLADEAQAFDDWLVESMTTQGPSVRDQRLAEWAKAPSARACHPREEHLLPLMVTAGAASADDAGSAPYRSPIFGLAVSAIRFG